MTQHVQSGQSVQVGFEGGGISPVQATKRLLSFGIDLQLEQAYDKFRPMGFKYDTITSVNKDWASGACTGRMTYDEMTYLLASVLANPTVAGMGSVTGAGAGTDAYTTWVFTPNSNTPDQPLAFSVEQGDLTTGNVLVYRSSAAVLKELGLKIDRQTNCELTGTLIGKGYQAGITNPTSGATSLASPAPIVIQPGQVDIFMDPTSAGLGTTRLNNCEIADLKIANRFDAWWVLSTLQSSWSEIVEQVPDVKLTLTMGADAQSIGILANARLGQSLFIRIRCTGPEIGPNSDVFNSFTFDFCGKVDAIPKRGVANNFITDAWEFTAIHDPTWGRAMEATLVNALPTTALASDIALVAQAPVLTSAVPAAPPLVHGTPGPVEIFGSGFLASAISGVTIGGVAATSVVVVSDSKIECTSPSLGSAGAKPVIATNVTGASNAVNVTMT